MKDSVKCKHTACPVCLVSAEGPSNMAKEEPSDCGTVMGSIAGVTLYVAPPFGRCSTSNVEMRWWRSGWRRVS